MYINKTYTKMKKTYISPNAEIVKIHIQQHLLIDSIAVTNTDAVDNNDDGYYDDI